jgi:uncharacterized SAM-binding protein YcdF (DUF218 family)
LSAVPVAGFALWNQLHFGSFLTVSAEVKQLRLSEDASLFAAPLPDTTLIISLGLCALAAVLALRGRGARPIEVRAAVLLAGLFPIAYVVVYVLRSPWQLWLWHTVIAFPGAMLALVLLEPPPGALAARTTRVLRAPAWVMALALVTVSGQRFYARGPGFDAKRFPIYAVAKELSRQTAADAGRFAMGDRAGSFAFLSRKPVLQIEGLAADRAMVEHIRRQDSLRDVLASYHVRRLVVTSPYALATDARGCTLVESPLRSVAPGPAPRMRGAFCRPVLQRVMHAGPDGDPGGDAYTWIFDLGEQP